jgi:multidrug efflux pump subunit AcrB
MGIVRFALKFPYTFYVLAAFIVFLGISAIAVMPEDIFPEINIPVVTVIWQYTGLSVPEMEQRITTYSEYSISANVTGIKDIQAQTLNGISVQKISCPGAGRDFSRPGRRHISADHGRHRPGQA